MTRRIIQFGTSRFLQAHVDLFVHEARCSGQDIGPITVVKTTSGGDRDVRISALKRGVPFPVRIRGIAANKVIDETVEVASVDSAFDAQQEWPAVVRCFAREAEIAVSNTGDTGFERSREDAAHDYSSGTPPGSFPAKLLALLLARFRERFSCLPSWFPATAAVWPRSSRPLPRKAAKRTRFATGWPAP
jgi:tagaturonate reductase